jgi:hypothetical protein
MNKQALNPIIVTIAVGIGVAFSSVAAYKAGAEERTYKLPPGESGDVVKMAVAFEKAPEREKGTYRAKMQEPEISGDFARARVMGRSSGQPDRWIYLKKVDGVWVVIGAATEKPAVEFADKYGLPGEWR